MTAGGVKALLEAGPGGTPGLWIDYLDYARRLFLGGDDPWGDPARFVNAFSQAQRLLNSDVIDVRVEDYMVSWLKRGGAGLEPARRPTSDLKQILADEDFRNGLLAVLSTLKDLAAGCAGLALTLPSPRRWLRLSIARTGGDPAEPLDEDYVEMSAMYIADYMRVFADAGVSAVLLEEDGDPGPEAIPLYQPILNVASGYQWSVGLLVPGEMTWTPGDGIDVCFAEPGPDAQSGVSVPEGYWTGKHKAFAFPDGCGMAYVRIPEDANPEQVLERLAALK